MYDTSVLIQIVQLGGGNLITIDYKSRVPIYDQIVNGFIRLKVMGVLNDGDKLPSVRQLALKLSVNPNTVQKAYAILEANGVIYSVSGKGSFVSGDETAKDAIVYAARDDFKRAVEEAYRKGLTATDLETIIKQIYKGGNGND